MTQEDHDRLIRVDTILTRIEHLLDGNGQPGIVQRVSLLEQFQTKIATGLTLIGFAVAAFGASLVKHIFWGSK